MVESQPSKLVVRVRFPSSAPKIRKRLLSDFSFIRCYTHDDMCRKKGRGDWR